MVRTRFATDRAIFIHGMFSNRALGEQCVQSATRRHRLNMEVDLQSLFGLHSSMSCDVHSCSHWLRPRNSLPPPVLRGRYWLAKINDISL